MNYYDARQRAGSNPPRWDYTCRNDDRIWPIGFCRPDDPDHCGGHNTPEAARECFARYIAAQGTTEIEYGDWTGCEHEAGGKPGDPECPNRAYHETHHYCPSCDFQSGEQCDRPTKKGLKQKHPLGQQHALCDEHRTPEIFEAMLPKSVGQITASW